MFEKKIVDIIAGARPNFMKIAPIIHEMKRQKFNQKGIIFRLIHTGQHYDKSMSDIFFDELNIPYPDVNLQSGSGTPAEQTSKIMIGYESLLAQSPSELCIVVGDVTSTMACSIVAKKFNIAVAHIEAGIRSFDLTMPEEINRLVTDSITDYFFTTSTHANKNLKKQGIDKRKIFFVGNTMIDTLLANKLNLKKPKLWEDENLSRKGYLILTLHRPSNVDNIESLKNLLAKITDGIGENLKVVFPVHPRTQKNLAAINFESSRLILTQPMSYLEFIYLIENSKAVITDSGGITEEATVLGIPCMTIRNNTERPETCEIGTNILIGTDPNNIKSALDTLMSGGWKKGAIPKYWDGNTAKRIVSILYNKILNIKLSL